MLPTVGYLTQAEGKMRLKFTNEIEVKDIEHFCFPLVAAQNIPETTYMEWYKELAYGRKQLAQYLGIDEAHVSRGLIVADESEREYIFLGMGVTPGFVSFCSRNRASPEMIRAATKEPMQSALDMLGLSVVVEQ